MSDKKLHDTWVFHYAPRGRNSKVSFKNSDMYKNQISTLGEFNTIKGFFEHYCFLKRPSDIPTDHKVMLFSQNKEPLWEVLFALELSKRGHLDHLLQAQGGGGPEQKVGAAALCSHRGTI